MHYQATEFPLLKHLDDLVENLRKLIPPALKGQEVEAVHDARVATRRLRAATQLLESVISTKSRKPFNRVTRRLRRQLGPLRDLDVMLEHLDSARDDKSKPAVDWLINRFSESRAAAVAAAQKEAPPPRMLARLGSWWGVRQEIAEARDAIEFLLAESVHLQLDSFAEQAATLGENDPHAWRIAGKSLRYTLEMAKAHGLPLSAEVTAVFKKIQDALGLWHDYVVLAERMLTEIVGCDLALHDPELSEQILSLAQSYLRKARAQLTKAAELWKPRSTQLSEEIRHAFPLTRVVVQAEHPDHPQDESPHPESVTVQIPNPPPHLTSPPVLKA
ncbi:MAG: CHAD domain-containing protein [Tepidisphaeraceae bacterium]